VETRLKRGSSRRSEMVPLLKVGRRRLMPNLEQVTCSEPTVTPISSAISSRLLPRSTRFLICCILSGVNFICRPELGPGCQAPRSESFLYPLCIFLFPGLLSIGAVYPQSPLPLPCACDKYHWALPSALQRTCLQNRRSGPCVGVHLGRDLPRAGALRKDRLTRKSAPTTPLPLPSAIACCDDDFEALRLPGYASPSDAHHQHRALAHG
jgi:hypothetical protein